MNYKFLMSATGYSTGQVVSGEDLDKNTALGGSKRLLETKTVEVTSDPVTPNPDDVSTPEKAAARAALATGVEHVKKPK